MGIFLIVLKIAGIVVLSLIALLLLIVLLVLFVPIRYRVDAQINETNLEKDAVKLKDNISGKASFSWLLHFVSGGISYPESKEFRVKVLCFTVFPSKNKKTDDLSEDDLEDIEEDESIFLESTTEKEEGFPESEDNSFPENTESEESISDSEDDKETNEDIDKDNEAENDISEDITNSEDDSVTSEDILQSEDEEDFEDEENGFFDFLEKIADTIARIIKVPQDVLVKIQYTTSRIYGKIDMVKNTLSNDIFKRAFEVTKKHVLRVLKMIIPRKFIIKLLIGLADPTVTADVLAAYGVMYPVLFDKVYVVPDFERQIISGEAHIRGRITVFTIVWAAAVLYFNKDVKKTVRRFKKIINS